MDTLKDLENKTRESVEYLKQQLFGMRSNRPSPKMVEDILVEVYGQKMTIKQLGAISIVPPMQIQIAVWDKATAPFVAKAIETSNLKINANVDGTIIRINLPPLSDERRNELAKVIKKEGEETRIKIRSLRDEANKKVSKDFDDGNIPEDAKFDLKEKIQKLIDKANADTELAIETKIKKIHE